MDALTFSWLTVSLIRRTGLSHFSALEVRRINMIAVLLPPSVGSLQNGGKFLGRTMKSQIELGTVFEVEL